MTGLGRMVEGMLVRRGVAADDLSAGLAHPKVDPRAFDLQALLAARYVVRERSEPDLIEVTANGDHQMGLPPWRECHA
jgi:hypothetical protein